MHTRSLIIFLTLAGVMAAGAAPTVPGLAEKHPLTGVQVGRLLLEELRCAACHSGVSVTDQKEAPDLTAVGDRVLGSYLKTYLENPAHTRPGTTMPNVLHGHNQADRSRIAGELMAYLQSQRGTAKTSPTPAGDAKIGKKLYHEIGCVACHASMDNGSAKTGAINALNHVSQKYDHSSLSAFLFDPLKVRPSGRMPDMKLSSAEARNLSAFLLGGANNKINTSTPNAALIAKGKKHFKALNCAACHSLPDQAAAAVRPLKNLNNGCLNKAPSKSAPDFQLTETQRAAIRKALDNKEQPTRQGQIAKKLTQLNCIACHERDDYGGVNQEKDAYFHSTEEALGNEARIPPQLTLVGAKLKKEWLNKVLYDGESIRPYMKTRMPQFGAKALGQLAAHFHAADKLPGDDLPQPKREENKAWRTGAQELLGDKGLNCVACHNFNGIESPGMKGLDVMTTYQRLQPQWFSQYMRNPSAFRPGIVMPSYWPGGEAAKKDVLGGNADTQLSALYYYFSLGRSARTPSGMRPQNTQLDATKSVQTYRGRSRVAGYRGIAVGFPNGLNYAFNAKNGAFAAVWKGKFVNVGWHGQGSGNFTPAERAIQLPNDVGIIPLKNKQTPWPAKPQTSKEKPTDPDPLYPRQHGYAFKGYSLGDADVPSFHYRSHTVEITETTTAVDNALRRKITLKGAYQDPLYIRMANGKIRRISDNRFQLDNLVFTIRGGSERLLRDRPEGTKELLIQIKSTTQPQTVEVDYAIQ